MILGEGFLRLLVRCLDAVWRKLAGREAGLSLLIFTLFYFAGMGGKHLGVLQRGNQRYCLLVIALRLIRQQLIYTSLFV